jgi:hypothetical protein
MSDLPVNLSTSGPPETVLAPEEADATERLTRALGEDPAIRHDAVSAVVRDHPRFLDGWAQLGRLGRDDMESYAAFRVGYHRGLDRLRQSGWRGNGYVRWRHESNRGFLRALEGLRATAERIGEIDEAERCELFLHQLEPEWPPADRDG